MRFRHSRRKHECCRNSFTKLGSHARRPGGGMAYAGDLKSSGPHRPCRFKSGPGHHIPKHLGNLCGFGPRALAVARDSCGSAFKIARHQALDRFRLVPARQVLDCKMREGLGCPNCLALELASLLSDNPCRALERNRCGEADTPARMVERKRSEYNDRRILRRRYGVVVRVDRTWQTAPPRCRLCG